MNIVLIILIIVAVIGAILYALRSSPEDIQDSEVSYDIPSMVEFIKRVAANDVSSDYVGSDSESFLRRERRKRELRSALRKSPYGSLKDKMYVKSYIKEQLKKVYNFNHENLDLVIPFLREQRLTPEDKFSILMQHFFKEHQYNAFSYMVDKYKLDEPKEDENGELYYDITAEDIDRVYQSEDIDLSLEDKIDIVTQRVYQYYRGLGVIDDLRDQMIDGVNGGAGGIPEEIALNMELEDVNFKLGENDMAHDYIYVFFRGVTMRLSFLSFGSEQELRRVVNVVYAYNSPGQLNQSNGHKINEMADGSRVVALAPKLTDSWAFFIRKFDATLNDISMWFRKKKGFEEVDDNKELVIKFTEFMAKGARTVGFTGQQGTGKTTYIRSSLRFFYSWWNLRVQEGSSFELWLRKSMKRRNIITFREIPKVLASMGIVVQKKTDGEINIIGEIADDETFSVALKAAQVASRCTWFSHHAQTATGLVDAGRDALMNTGGSSDALRAEEYVSRVLHFNVHLANDRGFRHIQRVTEYLPLKKNPDYPDDYKFALTLESILIGMADMFREYFYRSTDRETYKTQDIIAYENGRYVPKARPSKENLKAMMENMIEKDREEFLKFIDENWGEGEEV